jgi:acetyltransferase-like isoleucine patch superfamily enzyme
MRNLTRRVLRSGLTRLQRWWQRALELGTMPRFRNEPSGFEMRWPRSLVHAERMTIGRDVKLGPNSELKCNTHYPGGWMRHPHGDHVAQVFEPQLTIGDRVTATASLQVIAFSSVIIEDDVMFAANVFIADGTHAITKTDLPYKYQGVGELGPVRICRGAWIGQNAVINPGVTIGELAIVGANSVVTRDVPPRTIVGGVPARVVKRWNAESGAWERPVGEESVVR